MTIAHSERATPRVPPGTEVKSLIKQAPQTNDNRGQAGDQPGTTGDRTASIKEQQREQGSRLSPVFNSTGTGYRPRFYWLAPVSPVGPFKTATPTQCVADLKATKPGIYRGSLCFHLLKACKSGEV